MPQQAGNSTVSGPGSNPNAQEYIPNMGQGKNNKILSRIIFDILSRIKSTFKI